MSFVPRSTDANMQIDRNITPPPENCYLFGKVFKYNCENPINSEPYYYKDLKKLLEIKNKILIYCLNSDLHYNCTFSSDRAIDSDYALWSNLKCVRMNDSQLDIPKEIQQELEDGFLMKCLQSFSPEKMIFVLSTFILLIFLFVIYYKMKSLKKLNRQRRDFKKFMFFKDIAVVTNAICGFLSIVSLMWYILFELPRAQRYYTENKKDLAFYVALVLLCTTVLILGVVYTVWKIKHSDKNIRQIVDMRYYNANFYIDSLLLILSGIFVLIYLVVSIVMMRSGVFYFCAAFVTSILAYPIIILINICIDIEYKKITSPVADLLEVEIH